MQNNCNKRKCKNLHIRKILESVNRQYSGNGYRYETEIFFSKKKNTFIISSLNKFEIRRIDGYFKN
jgi:hypothetical protein